MLLFIEYHSRCLCGCYDTVIILCDILRRKLYQTTVSVRSSIGYSLCHTTLRIGFFLVVIPGVDHAEGAPTRFMVALGGVLSEGYGHGVCLGDGQTEAEGVTSQGGRGDALLRRIPLPPISI